VLPRQVQPVARAAATIRRVTVPKWKAMGRCEASIVTIQGSARSAMNGWIAGAVEGMTSIPAPSQPPTS
jgi:hypothetical protein